MFNSKGWIAIVLLLVIIALSLFATYTLIGSVGQTGAPTISEIKILDVVTWEQERPQGMLSIRDGVDSFYTNEELSLSCSFLADMYVTSQDQYSADYIDFMINITASFDIGFANDLNITFEGNYPQSSVFFTDDLIEPPYSYGLGMTNMSLVRYADQLGGSVKAYSQFASIGKPNTINVWINGNEWVFRSPQNISQSMEIAVSLTYYNGSVYKRTLQPISLKIGPDDNNTPDKAYILENGTTGNDHYIGGYDLVDCYNISLAEGETIHVQAEATPHSTGDNYPHFLLSLLDPSGDQVVGSGPGRLESLSWIADSGGEWTVEVSSSEHLGFYSLTVTTNG